MALEFTIHLVKNHMIWNIIWEKLLKNSNTIRKLTFFNLKILLYNIH